MSDLPPIILADDFAEHHQTAWRIEQAVPDPNNPLLEPKYPWDDAVVGCGHGTALKDPIDGKFKAWVSSNPEDVDYRYGGPTQPEWRLTYLESDDGVAWRRPELDLCALPGHPKTNVLFPFESGGKSSYASVHIDPEANPDAPYEMFCFRDPAYKCPTMTVAGLDQTPPKSIREVYRGPNATYGLYRYRSSDGIHWRPVEGPIALKTGDTCHIFKNPDGTYVAHHKDTLPSPGPGFVPFDVAAAQARTIMRRTSPDGTTWSDRQVLMAADWHDHQGDQIMELGRYPYRDGFIGVTAVYHAMSQSMDLQFAASRDGRSFWRPVPRRACLANAPLGDYGGGMIWPTTDLIEHEGRLHLYYGACEALHGDLYARERSKLHFHGAWCRASWEVGRLWAAASAAGGQCPGYLTTAPQDAKGKTLYVNAVTRPGGRLEAELLDEERKPVPGFTRQDCRPFTGDDKGAPLTWKDHAKCPRNGVHLRLWITRAFLYGFEWR